MSNPLLKAIGLWKAYGDIAVLKDVSISLIPGQAHAVIGPNGAGKTTLFKTLSGEVLPDRGTIEIAGRRCENMDGYKRVRMGVGRTFQVARVFGDDTVLRNMVVALESAELGRKWTSSLRISPAPKTAIVVEAMALLREMGLGGIASQRAGVLSYGDRKRLELSLALALKPSVLMLDEPMAGMSPNDRSASVEAIRRIVKERSISVLLTEHDMNVVFALADQITVLNYGEVIASGSPDEIRHSARVREVYLGQEEVAHA